jgi:phenylpropionate dioxygenase-like ring-hydroxylating dioxygenase large terminal subunit
VASKRFGPEEVEDDFVPKEDYLDPEFANLEFERLWPKVWQIACRLEELPKVGSYLTYEIGADSIIVVRTSEKDHDVKAFHNSCPHRGNQLVNGSGSVKQFVCSFHGWRYGLDGRCIHITDGKDWGGRLNGLTLAPVQVGVWGGWVWINMDPGCQPLEQFLEPMRSMCDKFELEKLRFAWYKTTIIPANWKTVVESFTEFYHLQTTHPQMLTYTQDYSSSRAMGRHNSISYDCGAGLPIGRSNRLPPKDEADFRQYVFEYAEQFKTDLSAMQTERAYQAVQRLRTELPPTAQPGEVLSRWGEMIYKAAIEAGSGWPAGLTPEYIAASGFDWHVFPNTVFLHGAVEAALWYRMRPNGTDRESCLFDVWSLERYAPGKEPPLKREFYPDWREGEWPLIFRQDFENIPKVHKGMRSRGFRGARTSPVQERAIANFHRVLRRFLRDEHADDDTQPEPVQRAVTE